MQFVILKDEYELDQYGVENMPSHPCDFSCELDGYRFLNT